MHVVMDVGSAICHLRTLRILGLAALTEEDDDIAWVAFSRFNVAALDMAIEALEEKKRKEEAP